MTNLEASGSLVAILAAIVLYFAIFFFVARKMELNGKLERFAGGWDVALVVGSLLSFLGSFVYVLLQGGLNENTQKIFYGLLIASAVLLCISIVASIVQNAKHGLWAIIVAVNNKLALTVGILFLVVLIVFLRWLRGNRTKDKIRRRGLLSRIFG